MCSLWSDKAIYRDSTGGGGGGGGEEENYIQ